MSEMHHNVGERELVSKLKIIGWRKIQRKRRELNPGKNFQGDFGTAGERLFPETSHREKIERKEREKREKRFFERKKKIFNLEFSTFDF